MLEKSDFLALTAKMPLPTYRIMSNWKAEEFDNDCVVVGYAIEPTEEAIKAAYAMPEAPGKFSFVRTEKAITLRDTVFRLRRLADYYSSYPMITTGMIEIEGSLQHTANSMSGFVGAPIVARNKADDQWYIVGLNIGCAKAFISDMPSDNGAPVVVHTLNRFVRPPSTIAAAVEI